MDLELFKVLQMQIDDVQSWECQLMLLPNAPDSDSIDLCCQLDNHIIIYGDDYCYQLHRNTIDWNYWIVYVVTFFLLQSTADLKWLQSIARLKHASVQLITLY